MKKIILMIIAVTLFSALAFSQSIIYVNINATGNNDGTSWTNAYTDPQVAFLNSSNQDEVWVAKGTYVQQPDEFGKPPARGWNFFWKTDSLKVYGGFDGTETSLSERDWKKNETIFSADYQNDGVRSNNAYHVFWGPKGTTGAIINYALMDGLIIEGGNANSSGSQKVHLGGGLVYDDYCKRLDVRNSVFRNNFATRGGALSFVAGPGTGVDSVECNVTNCQFYNNSANNVSTIEAEIYKGKGILRIENSLIYDNIIVDKQGSLSTSRDLYHIALYADSKATSLELINCTISKNNNNSIQSRFSPDQAPIGAIIDNTNSTLKVRNCIVYGNLGDSSTLHLVNNLSSADKVFYFENNILTDLKYLDLPTAINSNTIITDPQFTDTSTNDFTLQSGSMAIDKGDSTFLMENKMDIERNIRIQGNNVDLGCYEHHSTLTIKGVTKEHISLYPNPANTTLNIKTDKRINSIKVYSLQGKLLLETKGNLKQVNVSTLKHGVYTLQVEYENSIGYAKFIKN